MNRKYVNFSEKMENRNKGKVTLQDLSKYKILVLENIDVPNNNNYDDRMTHNYHY
jgi:hypothetical protein